MALTSQSIKYWAPDQRVKDWLDKQIPEGATVLEIGPGGSPFARATHFVDTLNIPNLPNFTKCDVTQEQLPYSDKQFDFVYCRHCLEDSWNPFAVMKEMERVAKAGYIETPSAIAELGRGVDATTPPYRGYHHHRWIIWESNGELRFLPKFPLLEYMKLDDDRLDQLLTSSENWNQYFMWEGSINWKHRESPHDFHMPRDYGPMLMDAIEAARVSASDFYAKVTS